MSLRRALVLALAVALASTSAGCIAGPQPEPPTGDDRDAAPAAPRSDGGQGGIGLDAAASYDASAPDSGAALDGGVSPGPIVIPKKPVDYPRLPDLGPRSSPPLVDGSHAAVDGGGAAP